MTNSFLSGSTSNVSIAKSQLNFPRGNAGKIVGVYDDTTEVTETDDNGENPETSGNGVLSVVRALPENGSLKSGTSSTDSASFSQSRLNFPLGNAGKIISVTNKTNEVTETDENGESPETNINLPENIVLSEFCTTI